MSTKDREEIETEIRHLVQSDDRAGAAAAAIKSYGPEILGFLVALHRSRQDADEVFSLWNERVWQGLGNFSWDCSLRTWVYTIARNASLNYARGERRRARKGVPLEEAEELLSRVERLVRTETAPYLRTEIKDKLAAIRQGLPAEDQVLLVLRLDKRLDWKDIARVLVDGDAPLGSADLARESQRLRKRFQHLKERLTELGRREGLLGDDDTTSAPLRSRR